MIDNRVVPDLRARALAIAEDVRQWEQLTGRRAAWPPVLVTVIELAGGLVDLLTGDITWGGAV